MRLTKEQRIEFKRNPQAVAHTTGARCATADTLIRPHTYTAVDPLYLLEVGVI